MKIETREKAGIVTLIISGEIDLYNAPELKAKIQQLLDQRKHKVIVDLDKVSYIDSSGIGALIASYSNLKKVQGRLRICNVYGSVRRVFDLTRLSSFFDIDATEDHSLEALEEE